jgi:uncharacterized Zn ribbon protein
MKNNKTYDRKGKELIIKDSEGTQLHKGDTVAYIRACYKDIKRGVIEKINPKSVKIDGSTRYSNQIIKI